MTFHVAKSMTGALGLCLQQVVLFGCVSTTHAPQEPPARSVDPNSSISEISKLPSSDAWNSVQFVGDNNAFLATPKSLWRSVDGGRTWEKVYETADYDHTITKVYFLDTSSGFLESRTGWFESRDGGYTWAPFVNPFSSSGRLRNVRFVNRNTGWIAGATLRAPSEHELGSTGTANVPRYLYDDITKRVFVPIVYRTDDAGKTWRAQTLPSNLGSIEQLSFLDSNYGIAVGDHEVMLTLNGGATWRRVIDPHTCVTNKDTPYEGTPASAYILDSSFAWITFDDGRMLRTMNGGMDWLELQPCKQNRPTVIFFLDQDRGYGLGKDGVLYKTTDSGKQWIKTATDKYSSLSFIDREHAWVVSDRALFRINLDRKP